MDLMATELLLRYWTWRLTVSIKVVYSSSYTSSLLGGDQQNTDNMPSLSPRLFSVRRR